MEDETDHLRRNSRAHTTVESSLLSTNPAFQFGSQGESSNTNRSREKMRIVDMTMPLSGIDSETPQHKRNKHFRKSSNGRGKRISSSFEATGVLCEFCILFKRK
jgi:kinetochore protein Mis13/DSN1